MLERSACERFNFQRQKTAQFPGVVLNVGANNDPADLKRIFGFRVLNCDYEAFDSALGHYNNVDIIFDAVKDDWPFPDHYADLVILGDMLEHLLVPDIEAILTKAYKHGKNLAITVPKDERIIGQEKQESPNPYMFHQTVVTEELLRNCLEQSQWDVVEWQTVDYVFVPEGYFVLCKRKTTPFTLGLKGGPQFESDND